MTWAKQNPVGILKGLGATIGALGALAGIASALGFPRSASATEQLADGVEASLHAGTSKVWLGVAAEVDGETIRFTARGAFDYASRQGRVFYNFSQVEGFETDTQVEARFIDDVAVIELPAQLQTASAQWTQVDIAAIDDLLDNIAEAGIAPEAVRQIVTLSDISVVNPAAIVRELERAGGAEEVGEGAIGDVETVNIAGTLPLVNSRRHVEATVWLGKDDGVIRRVELSGSRGDGRLETRIDFSYDGRTTVEVNEPAKKVLFSRLIAELVNQGGA